MNINFLFFVIFNDILRDFLISSLFKNIKLLKSLKNIKKTFIVWLNKTFKFGNKSKNF